MSNSLIGKQDEAKITVGDILKTVRETRNISIRAVSKATDISELAIQKIEKNASGGSVETIFKLCTFYEISMDDLLFWTTEESNTDIQKAKDILYDLLIKSVNKRAKKKN